MSYIMKAIKGFLLRSVYLDTPIWNFGYFAHVLLFFLVSGKLYGKKMATIRIAGGKGEKTGNIK